MSKLLNISFISILFCLVVATTVQAGFLTDTKTQELNKNLNNVSSSTYPTKSQSIEVTIASIIQIVLSLLGIVFVVLMFKAGISWMTADGNEEKVNKAKSTIINLIIGLVLVFAAYIITYSLSSILSGTLLKK